MLSHSSTGMPVVDAREDFLRARRAHVAARPVRRARVPRTLPGTADVPRGEARLEVIPLKAVVGTVEPTNMFDAQFRPASEFVRTRWARIALAHRRGVSLPPIRVLRGVNRCHVVDGRHRVSVALALGRRDIEAWVTPVRSTCIGARNGRGAPPRFRAGSSAASCSARRSPCACRAPAPI